MTDEERKLATTYTAEWKTTTTYEAEQVTFNNLNRLAHTTGGEVVSVLRQGLPRTWGLILPSVDGKPRVAAPIGDWVYKAPYRFSQSVAYEVANDAQVAGWTLVADEEE